MTIKKSIVFIGLSVVALVIGNYFLKLRILETVLILIWDFLKWSYKSLGIKLSIPIWLIIIIIFLLPIIKRIISIRKREEVSIPARQIKQYRKDTFKGIVWRWYWFKGLDGKWKIKGLRPYCPSCDSPFSESLRCSRCDAMLENSYPGLADDVELLIRDNVRKNFFPGI